MLNARSDLKYSESLSGPAKVNNDPHERNAKPTICEDVLSISEGLTHSQRDRSTSLQRRASTSIQLGHGSVPERCVMVSERLPRPVMGVQVPRSSASDILCMLPSSSQFDLLKLLLRRAILNSFTWRLLRPEGKQKNPGMSGSEDRRLQVTRLLSTLRLYSGFNGIA